MSVQSLFRVLGWGFRLELGVLEGLTVVELGVTRASFRGKGISLFRILGLDGRVKTRLVTK